MRVRVVAGPAAGEKRHLMVLRLLEVDRPVHAAQVHVEAGVDGFHAALEHLAGQLAHVAAGIVGEGEPEALVPDLAVPGFAEILGRAGAVEGVARGGRVIAGYPRRNRAFRQRGFALQPVLQVAAIVEGIGESFAHVGVREKVGGDARAVQLARAYVGVRHRVDLEGEKEDRVRHQAGQVVVEHDALQAAHLRLIGAWQVDDVRVAGLQHQAPGPEFLHGLHYDPLQMRGLAPVVGAGAEGRLLGIAVPARHQERAGAVGRVEEP